MARAATTAVLRPDHVGGVTRRRGGGPSGVRRRRATGSAGTMVTLVGITVVRSVEVGIAGSLARAEGWST